MKKATRLSLAICLSCIFLVVECVGGYLANSIAIYSDAAHLLADIAGFAIALIATIAAETRRTKVLTFGMARAEVLGAVGSMLMLWNITFYLLYAAVVRAIAWFQGHPHAVQGRLMLIVACFGIVVNSILGMVFFTDHGGTLHPAHSQQNCSCSQHAGVTLNTVPAKVAEDVVGDIELNETTPEVTTSKRLFMSSKRKGYDKLPAHEEKKRIFLKGAQLISPLHLNSTVSDAMGGNDFNSYCHLCTDQDQTAIKLATNELNRETLDVNLRAAYLHVLADLIQSFGVAVAGLVLWFRPDWQIIDPLCTLLFSSLALCSTVPMVQRLIRILLEGVPETLNYQEVYNQLTALVSVEKIHALHIWSISSKDIALTCHVRSNESVRAIREVKSECKRLGIRYVTVQVNNPEEDVDCCEEGEVIV